MERIDYYKDIINRAWETKSSKMNWLGLEKLLVDILRVDDVSDADKIQLIKESIDAFTRRGHFI